MKEFTLDRMIVGSPISELSIKPVADLDLIPRSKAAQTQGRIKHLCSFCWNEIFPARRRGLKERLIDPLIGRQPYDCDICNVRFYKSHGEDMMLFSDAKLKSPKRFSELFMPDPKQPLSFHEFKVKLWQVQLERLSRSNRRR